MTQQTNVGVRLEQYDFEYLMGRAIQKVPNSVDAREGSIIYDALAPTVMELAEMYMELRQFYLATFIKTSFDQYLDLRVAEQNLIRHQAVHAVRIGEFTNTNGEPMEFRNSEGELIDFESNEEIDLVFATIHPTNSIRYRIIGKYERIVDEADGDSLDEETGATKPSYYELECLEAGVIGNSYVGHLLPVSHINGLGIAEIRNPTPIISGQDIESDESLRTRFFEAVNSRAFGGNVANYRHEIMNNIVIPGMGRVGGVQIYPAWNGGGTVGVVVLSSTFDDATPEFVNAVQEELHPDTKGEGSGLGIAPIGHRVTVVTAQKEEVAVTVKVGLTPGTVLTQVQSAVRESLGDYFLSLRQGWDKADDFNHHRVMMVRSQIVAALLSINGITDVEIYLNHRQNNIELPQVMRRVAQSSEDETGRLILPLLPYLGELTITEMVQNRGD